MLTDVVIANKSYTKFTVAEEDELDVIALKVMKQDCPDFLLPIRTMEIDGELEIRYELAGGMRLAYEPREMYKKEFYNMLINMLIPFKNCNDWFLDYHYILLDDNYILVDKGGQSVKYVYLPVASCANTDEQIRRFFMDLILRTTVLDDRGSMVEPLRIINSSDANLMVLLDYLMRQGSQGGGQPAAKQEPQPQPRRQEPQPQPQPRRQEPQPQPQPKQQTLQPAAEENKGGKFGFLKGGSDRGAEKQQQGLNLNSGQDQKLPDGSRPGQISKEFGKSRKRRKKRNRRRQRKSRRNRKNRAAAFWEDCLKANPRKSRERSIISSSRIRIRLRSSSSGSRFSKDSSRFSRDSRFSSRSSLTAVIRSLRRIPATGIR